MSPASRDAGIVHVGDRDRQREAAPVRDDLGGPGRGPALGPQDDAVALRDQGDRVGADVVAGVCVLASGVAQSDREEVGRRAGRRTRRADRGASSSAPGGFVGRGFGSGLSRGGGALFLDGLLDDLDAGGVPDDDR